MKTTRKIFIEQAGPGFRLTSPQYAGKMLVGSEVLEKYLLECLKQAIEPVCKNGVKKAVINISTQID